MYIRKISVAASLATGAALALTPFAHADDFSSIVASEIASENSIFQYEATLAGVPSSDYHLVDGSDTIRIADIAKDAPTSGTPSLLDYELYGAKPFEAVVSSDSGSFNIFNGAVTKFDDALNVGLYALENKGALIPADDLFGNHISDALQISHGVAHATPMQAFDYFLNFGVGDLKGYLGDFGSTTTATSDAVPGAAAGGVGFNSLLTDEANGLNALFTMDAHLAGIPSSDIIPGSGVLPFDTIATAHTNSLFDSLVFGLNPDSVTSGVPGSYDVLNGALGEFANAFNVDVYSMLNGGDMLPVADLIGTHSDFLTGSVSTAIGDFIHLGLSDVAGYFDFGALAGSL